jgi:predicted nucleotide-binding protein
MAKRPANPVVPAPKTIESLRIGIRRIEGALKEVENFDPQSTHPDDRSSLDALCAHISEAVDRAFTEGTAEHSRYMRAASIYGIKVLVMGRSISVSEYQQNIASDLARSKALLTAALGALSRDLGDLEGVQAAPPQQAGRDFTNKVFVVHGRAVAPKVEVARLLESMGIEAIILHEQPNRGRSTIEKIEAYGDVDFAVVIFTPDDVGALEGEEGSARPRQNVLFELGYFIAKLGRQNVCVLRQGEMEMLTDYVGPIWIDYDAAGAWKTGLGNELQDAGFEIDWNVLMGRRKR